MHRERVQWIDVAKGIGMILVVIGHTPGLTGWIYKTIYSFHMPLFFFLSGFVYREQPDSLGGRDGKLVKDFRTLIVPYVLFVLITGISVAVTHARGGTSYYSSIRELCFAAFYASGSEYGGYKMIGELWFLPAMFWARRYMSAVFVCKDSRIRFLIVCALVGMGIGLSKAVAWPPSDLDIALLGAGFMYAGWMLHTKPDLMDDHRVLCGLLMIYATARFSSTFEMSNRNYSDMWFVSFPGAIAMSIIVCRISKAISAIPSVQALPAYIGRHSLLFLFVHSLDWLVPYPLIGASYLEPYAYEGWYLALFSVHRFCIDLLGTVLLLACMRFLRPLLTAGQRKTGV